MESMENFDRNPEETTGMGATSGNVPPSPPFPPRPGMGDSRNNGARCEAYGGGAEYPPFPPYYAPRPSGFWGTVQKVLRFLCGAAAVFAILMILFLALGVLGLVIGLVSSDGGNQIVAEKVISGSEMSPVKIAILPIEGTITENEEGFIRNAIQTAYEDDRVNGLILRVDSPGGTISGSDYYYKLLGDLKAERKIPVAVSMGGMATSGGYYVSMVGDRIFAERSTITGSIGVIGMLFDASNLCEKIGISSNFIVSGPNKGMGDFTKPMTPEERAIWQGLIDDSYEQFLSVVREGRPCFAEENGTGEKVEFFDEEVSSTDTDDAKEPDGNDSLTEPEFIPPKPLREIADGRVYSANEALNLGLIDEIGFLQDTVEWMIDKLGAEESDVQVVRYKKTAKLSDLLSAETGEEVNALHSSLKAISRPTLYYLPGGVFPLEAR